jgi:hypothetical protein
VGDQHDGNTEFAIDAGEQIEDRPRRLRVERRGRLVREQYIRPCCECARDTDALLLAAGQLGRIAIVFIGNADKIEQFGNPDRDIGLRPSRNLERQGKCCRPPSATTAG